MATVAADTSFLFSLFGNDAHSALAQTWVRKSRTPLIVSALGHYELANAFRFAAFRGVISQADALGSLSAVEADSRNGNLQLASLELSAVLREATRLSELHTITGGHCSFDILHVATARLLKATTFLTFDANQRKLAAAVGLVAGP